MIRFVTSNSWSRLRPRLARSHHAIRYESALSN